MLQNISMLQNLKKDVQIDGLILDVDGTLWDSTPIVASAWTKAVRKNGCEGLTITADMLRQLFGKTMNVIADMLLPELPAEERYRIMDVCCEYEHKALAEDECNICYTGVVDTIRTLSEKLPLFIVSNCQSGYIELFLEKTGLSSCIKDIECFGNTGKKKSENMLLLMERNHLMHPIYVGDTQGDREASYEAGIPFIFASYGFGSVEDKKGQINTFSELLTLIQE